MAKGRRRKAESDANRSAARRQWLIYAMLGIALLALLGAGVSAYRLSKEREVASREIERIDRQYVVAESLYSQLPLAVTGDREVFNALRAARAKGDEVQVSLVEGSLSPTQFGTEFSEPLEGLKSQWRSLDEGLDLILQAETSVVGLRELLEQLRDHMNGIASRLDRVVALLKESSAPAIQVTVTESQQLFAREFGTELSAMVDGGMGARDLDNFKRNVELLDFHGRAASALLLGDAEFGIEQTKGNEVRQALAALRGEYETAVEQLRRIMSNTLVVVHLRDTVDALTANRGGIAKATDALRAAYHQRAQVRSGASAAALIFAGLGILSLLGAAALIASRREPNAPLAVVTTEPQPLSASAQSADDQRNQDAILRLLDEISVLAEGDLRAQATVTEDMTGAIADAVNYAIEALREIVLNINDTASEVDKTSRLSQARATKLGQASETQRLGVARVNDALLAMGSSVDRIAQQASESSQVAESSVEIANAGAVAVRDTIAGMDVIRETIQETAKRIKRLGESSQEIGDIVGLIDDIADQTNVLALNAAIQASMAGEAGRGFAVVADEVQRLAERAGQATKQIDNLVKAIQSDTHEAVASMESSTAGVVSGAQLSEDAGQALERIETVSQQLAERINSITELAHQHTQQTANITEAIRQIQQVSEQTHQGVLANEESMETLAELAEALRKSVEGFRLPEHDTATTVSLPKQIAARRAAAQNVGDAPRSGNDVLGVQAHGGGSANASAN
ncbi:MAG: methyl-accepting chemotaxis protein [Pseudomonadota bacterium]